MTSELKAVTVITGEVEGELIVSRQPFSYFGGFDFVTGQIVDPKSDIYGMIVKDKIFAYPRGKGSSSTAGVILEALRRGTAPKAIINVECEKILAVGAIVAEVIFGWNLPLVCLADAEFQRLSTGRYIRISGKRVAFF